MSDLTQTQFESSDDEPEEVAFDASKRAALKSVKDALESAKREKNLLKEKRRKRQQLFQEQKKRKLLPEDLLEEFDTEPQKQTEVTDNNKDEEEATNTSETISKSLPENYTVIRLKDESAFNSLQQSAVDFIQSRFYGPRTNRTTNAELLSLNKKRGVNKGAAVQFSNKKWAADVKANVAKTNKRFMHKEKLIPT